jgi:hypothetical protein
VAYENGGTVLSYVPSDIDSVPSSGSILRQKLIQKIQSKSLSHPELNVHRRKFEDEHRGMYYKSGQSLLLLWWVDWGVGVFLLVASAIKAALEAQLIFPL